MFGPEENTMLGLEDAVRIMLGIDQPPNMVDPYPREAAPLIILLKDRKIGWDEDSHKSVDRVAHVLAQNPGTAWIDNPPSQQFAKDRNVTGAILYAYKKHRAFVAAGETMRKSMRHSGATYGCQNNAIVPCSSNHG